MRAVRQPQKRSRKAADVNNATEDKPRAGPTHPTSLELRGIEVHFPFKPYKCQETYMEKVIDALNRSENALLESPTGTGKTLCLLCSALAWQREQARCMSSEAPAEVAAMAGTQRSRLPTVIYASRTHSQLSQVVRELRNTRYRPRHAVLGSREQMCVNPKVKTALATAADINFDCNRLGKDHKCKFKNQLEGFKPPNSELGGNDTQPVLDMEDLVAMGKTKKVCPFFYTRSLVEDAELILVPYNYLFDKEARESTLSGVAWDNAVVIFDEAHNLESFASESASFDLSTIDIAGGIAEVTRALVYVQTMPEMMDRVKLDDLARMKALLLNLEDHIINRLSSNSQVFSGEYMMEIFKQGATINHSNHEIFIREAKKVSDLVMDMRSSSSKGQTKLDFLIGCIKRVFGETTEGRCLAKAAAYRVHVSPQSSGKGRTVSYWCFAPSLAMQELSNLNVRSVVVTSGTLSPLPSYSLELGLPFPHTLENPHIIADDQIYVRVIGKGVSGKLLNSSFNRRDDEEYIAELGNTLSSLARVVPGGMLVFFPSYSVMESCIDRWGGPASKRRQRKQNGENAFFAPRQRNQSNGANRFSFPHDKNYFGSTSNGGGSRPWSRLLSNKAIVVEPKSTADLPEAIADFHKFLGRPNSTGCILMGVCRGKISEGIDFAHDMCRAVVITGLPFPPYLDPKVKLKREYLDGVRAGQNIKPSGEGGFGEKAQRSPITLSGAEWYSQQAHRAVNQAIGRVIRNKQDYGAVLLLDSRFGETRNQNGLSKWVRTHILGDEGFGKTVGTLVQFYKRAARQTNLRPNKAKRNNQVVLAYEEEEENVPIDRSRENSAVKVAVVKAESHTDEAHQSVLNGFVPKDQVVARMDVTASKLDPARSSAQPSRGAEVQKETGLAALYDQAGREKKVEHEPLQPNMGSWSHLSRARGLVPAQKLSKVASIPRKVPGPKKAVAAQFFDEARRTMSSADLASLRKLVVTMKKQGDAKDSRSYLRTAKGVVDILAVYEGNGNGNQSLLGLLYPLLPKLYRHHVEKMAFKQIVEKSDFLKSCRSALEQSRSAELAGTVLRLLKSHCLTAESGEKRPNSKFLADVRQVLEELASVDVPQSSQSESLVDELVRVFPPNFRRSIRAMQHELNADGQMKRMQAKEVARVGESALKFAKTFDRTPANKQQYDQSQALQPEDIDAQKSMAAALDHARELNQAKRASVVRELKMNSQSPAKFVNGKISRNRSSLSPERDAGSKKARVVGHSTSPTEWKARGSNGTKADQIARCLEEAGSESYLKMKGQARRQIRSNCRKLKCRVCEQLSAKVGFQALLGRLNI